MAGRTFTGRDGLLVALLVLAVFAVYANSLDGEFVYDDETQIVGNFFIQDADYHAKALVSDVWAFSRDPDRAASNYWRPTFVAWLILNYYLFGVDNPLGWHLSNVLLHGAVVALAYLVMRQLRLAPTVAAAIALVYAVHPAHVESVAWISGSPNMLVALPLLAAWFLILANRSEHRTWRQVSAVALFAVGQLAKEVAILFPVILAVTLYETHVREERPTTAWRRAVRETLPFVAVSVLFLIARFAVLGQLQQDLPFRPGNLSLILTAPSILAFYLRQTLLPVWIGPLYSLRPVTPENLGLANFWLPVLIVAVIGTGALWAARRIPATRLGLLLFALPLLPSLNINAFPPEEIVHDRYLYLPAFGALWALGILAVAAGARSIEGAAGRREHRGLLVAALLVSIPCAWVTVRYNRAWHDGLSLWSAAMVSDPSSASGAYQYGATLHREGRLDEAREALDRALSIHPLTNAYISRADVAMEQRRFADAERDLHVVLNRFDDFFKAYERLVVCYQEQDRWSDAEAILRTAREKIPYRRAELTGRLAVILYRDGRKAEALAELESARERVDEEPRHGAKEVYLRLGQLYAEVGRYEEARQALARYLAETERYTEPYALAQRVQAHQILDQLAGR